MPRFARKSVRRYRRKRTLRTRNIFLNKGARSQAVQIAALNRKVNKVYRTAKPEVKILYKNAQAFNFDSQTLLNTYKSFMVDVPELGTSDNQRIGNYIKTRNIQFNVTMEYYNSSTTGYHNGESAGTSVRIIVGQYKQAVSASTPGIAGVLQESANTGAAYTNQSICPLNTQISEFCRILYDRRFTITSSSNQKLLRFNVYPRPFRFNREDNQYNGVWIMILSAGLHADSNFSEFVEGTLSYKLAYTDS